MILITIKFVVGTDYIEGDYAILYGNGGEGNIDWETPLTEQIPLFPNRQGIYGYGHAPYGQHPYGKAHSTGPLGYGHLPYGKHPYGYGSELIEAYQEVSECGDYKFAFAAYDEAGNEHEGTPDEITVTVHIAPQWPPKGLKKNSYNKTTDVLVLDVAL